HARIRQPDRAAGAALPSHAREGGCGDGVPTCRLEQIAADAEIRRYAPRRAEEWVPGEARTRPRSAVDVEAEREATGVAQLRLLLQRMEARALDIAEGAFEPDAAIKGGAARDLHRALDRADRALAGQRAGDHRATGRLGAGH